MGYFLQVLSSGLALGCIYGLIALGVVVVFSATRLLNFAQGEFLMLGGLAAYLTLGLHGWPFAVTVVVVLAVGALAGALLYGGIVRPLLARGTAHITIAIATLGVSIVVSQLALLWAGPESEHVPSALTGAAFRVGSVSITAAALSAIVGSVLALLMFAWIRSGTRTGLALRAIGANRLGARVIKLNVGRLEATAFALSGAAAAFGGLMITPITGWTPTMGLDLVVFGFIAAIVGGIANPYTAFAGGILIGVLTAISQAYLPARFPFSSTLVFAALVLVMAVRPGGILPSLETKTGALRS